VQSAATRSCNPPIRWFSSAVSVADKAASAILVFLHFRFGSVAL
jgi:hypothetical protein